MDAATNIYVSDFYNCALRRLTRGPAGWVVTTVAGKPPVAGRADGVATFARFQFSTPNPAPTASPSTAPAAFL